MSTYRDEREIFSACLELTPSERPDYLREAVSGDQDLEARLVRLLAAHERAEGASLSFPPASVFEDDVPDSIGAYKIRRVLGSGGMGVVYEAEQTQPVSRLVALKIIKTGMDTRRVVARFEAERQALAVMDHPNIAKVLDGGATPEGRPYFVMELVKGVPLVEYCNRHRLGTRARIDLFIVLCKAVQHAHQKGVIHRDLKPSNVLVSEQDGEPFPKVIDFGIAKAVGRPLTENTLVTEHDQVIGTAAYMSPEQAGVTGLDVDTRSDVYSLGVMLYELLVDALPVDPEEIGLASYLSRLAKFELDPPPPSAKLQTSMPLRKNLAGQRATDPLTLFREVRGDLDWIVMKAMERDRSRRYETVNALAMDLERYLGAEPVLARSPSLAYRLSKFIRRNRAGVIAAVVTLAAILAGMTGMTIGLFRATRAEAEAKREAQKAALAGHDANRRLRNSLLAQARANRHSRLPGRRFASLDLLTQAATIDPGADLRDEAIACLTLTDLRPAWEWRFSPSGPLVAFNPDLTRYVVGLKTGQLELRASRTGEFLRALGGPGVPAWVAHFSPDERFLAVKHHGRTQYDQAVTRVWDIETARPVLTLEQPVGSRSMDFHPTSPLLALGMLDRRLIVLDVTTGKRQLEVPLDSEPIELRFRPDGRALALAMGASGRVDVRDCNRGRLLQSFSYPTEVSAVGWSSDARYVIAGYDDARACVWEVATGRKVTMLKGHQAEVVDTRFLPDSRIAMTYSWDETTRLWDAFTGEELLAASDRVLNLSRDGKRLSFVTGQKLGIWEVLHGEILHTLHGHTGKSPNELEISSDSRRAASGGDDGVLLWDLDTYRLLGSLPAGKAVDVFFDPTGALFSCGSSGLIRWTLSTHQSAGLSHHAERLSAEPCKNASIDTSGHVVAHLTAGTVRILFLNEPARNRQLEAPRGSSRLTLSPDAKWVAAGSWRGNQVSVWNTQTGELVASLLPGSSAATVLFSPDSKWLVTGTSQDYRLWSVPSWREASKIERPPHFSNLPGRIVVSADGTILAAVMDQRSVRFFRVGSGDVVATFESDEPQSITALRFSPNRELFAVSTHANQIQIWNLERIRNELRHLKLDTPREQPHQAEIK
jgi:serine/threonine protein kinase/WD40 repeat protein